MKTICVCVCVCVKALSLLCGVQEVCYLQISLAHQASLSSFLNQLHVTRPCFLLPAPRTDDGDLQTLLLGHPCSLLPVLRGGGDLQMLLAVPCSPLPLIPPAQGGGDLQMPAPRNPVDGCAMWRREGGDMEGGCICMRCGGKA